MKLFSTTSNHTVLCDTPLCFAEVRLSTPNTPLFASRSSPAETVLCVMDGELRVDVEEDNAEDAHYVLGAMEGIQIPSRRSWSGQMGAAGGKVLRADSFHPHLKPGHELLPALMQPHRFAVADGQMLIYTDYIRGGVLNFRPSFAADKHFHQDADELFWFFQGRCRVETPDGVVVAAAGTIIYTTPGEWHIIENADSEPLLMFVTITPNIVPSHTFFDADNNPVVRSSEPLRGR